MDQALNEMIKQTKCGASVWTTFRWLANLVFGVCWIVALPAELMLNRRIGRRYAGLLPLLFAIPVFWLFVELGQEMMANSFKGASRSQLRAMNLPEHGFSALWPSGVLLGLLGLCLIGHRLANWHRFRSTEQVHSFSNGIPFWVLPPMWLIKLLPKPKPPVPQPKTASPEQPQLPASADVTPDTDGRVTMVGSAIDTTAEVVLATTPPSAVIEAKPAAPSSKPLDGSLRWVLDAAKAIVAHLKGEWRSFVHEWRQGEIPTGAITWIASTIVHPILLSVVSVPIAALHVGFGAYLGFAAIAIFVKARIQKALVVESVYDIFDARIEQEFTSALAHPGRLRAVERTGFAVPGIARIAAQAVSQSSQPCGKLDPQLEALMLPAGDSGTV